MAVTLSAKYLAELKNPNKIPSVFMEINLGGSTVRWGNNKIMTGLVHPVLQNVSKQHNKLDVKQNIVTKGSLSFSVVDSSYVRGVITGNRLKNLRVKKYDGFISSGWDDTDYIKTFEGVIYDIDKDGEIWTIQARDIRQQTQKVVPVAETDKTHYIDYSDENPIDIMKNLIETQAGIPSADYDGTVFDSERDAWYNGWKFFRVLPDSKPANKHLAELQVETNSYIHHAGDKISIKSFAPTVPGATVREMSDDYNILAGSVSSDLGYVDGFSSRIEVRYDYDESGNSNEENFESMEVAEDTNSQTDWREIKTKVIKAKWIRSLSFDQPVNITGCVVYAISKDNGTSAGKTGHQLSYNFTNKTLTWVAPDGTVGTAVTIDRSGRYQVKSLDERKYVRVIVDITALPGSNQTDALTITSLSGSAYALTLATRLLNRYLNPVPTIKASVDYRDINNNGVMYSPTDIVNITTDEVVIFEQDGLNAEPCIILSVKPDEKNQKIRLEAMPTRLGQRGAYIAPAGYPDYASATGAQRQYCYIGRASDGKVFDGADWVRGYNSII